ncbi:MAG: class I SAM-dependent methyltransferase [Bacteroidetes bacterium]|nr:class I SAM-dependent methyltransferase [Bacteroidota bacterium]
MNLNKILFLIRNPQTARTLLSFYWQGYLSEIGWIKSFDQKIPVGKNNEPLPWVTYSFIHFVKDRLHKGLTIAEFGSGNSTLFYAQQVKKVLSVEHELDWYEKIREKMPANVELTYRKLDQDGEYAKFLTDQRGTVDIVIVDGRDRVNCIKNSLSALSRGGIVVLDDSERLEYKPGIEFLLQNSFKKIDFWGLAPGVFYNKSTTVFYKEENCLSI